MQVCGSILDSAHNFRLYELTISTAHVENDLRSVYSVQQRTCIAVIRKTNNQPASIQKAKGLSSNLGRLYAAAQNIARAGPRGLGNLKDGNNM